MPPSIAGPLLQLVHEDEDVRIELTTSGSPADTVAVTFDPIQVNVGQSAYAGEFLRRAGVDTLAVRKQRDHFYQPLSLEDFEVHCRPWLERYQRRIAYGSSLGAYAVLYYCRHGFDCVIASSPRVSAHPRFGVAYWQQRITFLHEALDPDDPASSGAVVFYDPHDEIDRRLVEDEIAPSWPHARLVRVPYGGHPVNQFLSEVGFIAPFVRAVAAARPTPALSRRGKARSSVYHQVLAMGCLRHHKHRWARRLCDRALELNPQLSLARRTRGQALLALGKLDAAEADLRSFAALYPLDGEAHDALQVLAAQRAAGAAVGTGAAAPGAGGAPTTGMRAGHPPGTRAGPPARGQLAPRRVSRNTCLDLPPPIAIVDRAQHSIRRRLAPALLHILRALGLTVSRDDVIWCYRQFLGRDPESEQAILWHRRFLTFRGLVRCIVSSPEYSGRRALPALDTGAPARTIGRPEFHAAIDDHLDRHPEARSQ